MKAVLDRRLEDDDADQVRRSHAGAIKELQLTPIVGAVVITSVVLPDATDVAVPHKLGRAPRWVGPSVVKEVGAIASVGIIVDLGVTDSAGNPVNRSEIVVLRASGYGATVAIDLLVVP